MVLFSANNGTYDPSTDPTLQHDDHGPIIRASVWILLSLAAVFLGLRLYCKFWKFRRLFWDDVVLIASFCCLLVNCCLLTAQISLGFGKHAWDVQMENLNGMTLLSLLGTTFLITAQAWSKTSFAMTLLRIAGRRLKYFIWFLIVSTNILLGGTILIFWIQCTPLEKSWRPLTPGTCWDPQIFIRFVMFASIYSGIMDLALAFLPWNIILTLQIGDVEKFGVALAMSLGVVTATSAFVKTAFIPGVASSDFSYTGMNVSIWGFSEPAITIMAASIPVMRVLLRDITSGGYFLRRTPKEDQDAVLPATRSRKSSNPPKGQNAPENQGVDRTRAREDVEEEEDIYDITVQGRDDVMSKPKVSTQPVDVEKGTGGI